MGIECGAQLSVEGVRTRFHFAFGKMKRGGEAAAYSVWRSQTLRVRFVRAEPISVLRRCTAWEIRQR